MADNKDPFADLIPAKGNVRTPTASDDPFADLVPRKDAKPKRSLTVRPAEGEDPFADLVPPQGEQGPPAPQTPNIGAKGNMRPGDKPITDVQGPFARNATFNFGDEAVAGLGVPVDMIVNALSGEGPTDPREVYDQIRAFQAAQAAATEERKPVASTAAGIGGALLPAGGGLKFMAQGTNLVSKGLRGAAAGVGIGALSGAGDDTGEGRLANAETGALVGGTVGLVAPGAAKLAGQGYRLVRAGVRAGTAPIRALRRPEEFAAAKVAEAAKRDQMSTQRLGWRLKAAKAAKPEAVLADVGGPNTQKLLRAAANVPSDSRAGLTRKLHNRQEGQRVRLQDDLADAFGDPKSFHSTVESLATSRKSRAGPLFQAAENTPTPYTAKLQEVLSRPLTKKLVAQAEEAAANRGEKSRAAFMDKDGKIVSVPDTAQLHRIKVAIDDAIRKIKKREDVSSLGNVSLRDLTILKQHLVGAIDNSAYKKALREFAGDSSFMNAIDEGFEEGLTMEPEKIAANLSRLSPGEADMWRLGFARAVANKMRDSGPVGANRAEKLYSPAFMDRMMVVFRDPKSRAKFLKRLNMERRMNRTKTAAEGNSTTASQLAEGAEAGVDADNVREFADMGQKLANGNVIGALVSWVGRAKNMATGLRPEVADEIIKLLTTNDPAKVARAQKLISAQLAKLQRRQGTPGRISKVINTTALGSIPSLQSAGQ